MVLCNIHILQKINLDQTVGLHRDLDCIGLNGEKKNSALQKF